MLRKFNNITNWRKSFPKCQMSPTYWNFANHWHICPNMQPKSGFISNTAKQGKLTVLLYKTPEQSPSLKQVKTSSREFTVHSLLYAAQTQNQIDWQACKCSGNEPVSVVLQEPFNKSSSQKLHSPTDKLTNKNLTAKQGALHKTLKICLCFICLFRFV